MISQFLIFHHDFSSHFHTKYKPKYQKYQIFPLQKFSLNFLFVLHQVRYILDFLKIFHEFLDLPKQISNRVHFDKILVILQEFF